MGHQQALGSLSPCLLRLPRICNLLLPPFLLYFFGIEKEGARGDCSRFRFFFTAQICRENFISTTFKAIVNLRNDRGLKNFFVDKRQTSNCRGPTGDDKKSPRPRRTLTLLGQIGERPEHYTNGDALVLNLTSAAPRYGANENCDSAHETAAARSLHFPLHILLELSFFVALYSRNHVLVSCCFETGLGSFEMGFSCDVCLVFFFYFRRFCAFFLFLFLLPPAEVAADRESETVESGNHRTTYS